MKKNKKKLKNIKLDFVSSTILDGKPEKNKINFILNKVKNGSILVIDGVLKPKEEIDLIKETMRRVDDGFPGIEVCSLKKELKGFYGFFDKLSSGKDKLQNIFSTGFTGRPIETSSLKTGITLVGPAKIIKRIKKNPDSFSVLAEV
jgi:hypothetical protein